MLGREGECIRKKMIFMLFLALAPFFHVKKGLILVVLFDYKLSVSSTLCYVCMVECIGMHIFMCFLCRILFSDG